MKPAVPFNFVKIFIVILILIYDLGMSKKGKVLAYVTLCVSS